MTKKNIFRSQTIQEPEISRSFNFIEVIIDNTSQLNININNDKNYPIILNSMQNGS